MHTLTLGLTILGLALAASLFVAAASTPADGGSRIFRRATIGICAVGTGTLAQALRRVTYVPDLYALLVVMHVPHCNRHSTVRRSAAFDPRA